MKKMIKGFKTVIRDNVKNLLIVLTVATVLLVSGVALASDYPAKPITWIVMWPAGGGGDTATRTFTKYFE